VTKTAKQLDHEIARAIVPGIRKWNMTAGGLSAAEGKHGYGFVVPQGTYHIWPFTTKHGRHAGYRLRFAATGGQPRGGHSGLWHDLGTFSSPQQAATAARKHYAGSF
jgi:hypothetical protein